MPKGSIVVGISLTKVNYFIIGIHFSTLLKLFRYYLIIEITLVFLYYKIISIPSYRKAFELQIYFVQVSPVCAHDLKM